MSRVGWSRRQVGRDYGRRLRAPVLVNRRAHPRSGRDHFYYNNSYRGSRPATGSEVVLKRRVRAACSANRTEPQDEKESCNCGRERKWCLSHVRNHCLPCDPFDFWPQVDR
jgi:hypothetical protein